MASTSTTTLSNGRFQRLLQALDKTLSKSRSQFDTEAAVSEYYGEETAAIFDDTSMLRELLDTILEDMHDNVMQQVKTVLNEHNVKRQLDDIDNIFAEVENEKERIRLAEEQDKQSAREALETIKLPKGWHASDVVTLQAYEVLKKEHDTLLEDIGEMEKEIQELEAQGARESSAMEEQLQRMQQFGKQLEETADACSMVS